MSSVLESPILHSTKIVPYDDKYEAQVLSLAREMRAESVAHRGSPLNESKLLSQLRLGVTTPDTVYFKLVVRGDEVLGGFFGIITGQYFSDDRAARDMAWFVKRDRRGGFAAVMLVHDFEEWGKARGIKHFWLGQSTGVSIEQTQMLYEKLGYKVVGVNTMKEV